MNQTPPGYPLAYIRERHEITCNCGNVVTFSRLLIVERSTSSGRKMRPAGKSESVYDIEISEVKVIAGTPRCDICFDTTPKELIPRVHALDERLKPRWGQAEIDVDDLDLS